MKHILYCLIILLCAENKLFAQTYNTLLIPDTIAGTTFNLIADESTKQFRPGNPTTTAGYNGNFLGPTLFFKRGDTVHLNVTNNLSDTTTVHWHGMHLPAIMDGGPHQAIAPGTIWQPFWKVTNFAATYWYHPHLHRTTEKQVTSGMTGFIIVRDAEELALNLPRKYGIDDVPLAITDRRFSQTNQFVIGPYGDTVLVNGTLNPEFTAPAQVVRFRLLGAAVQRSYNIGFSDNRTFYVIATDGGLVNNPIPVTRYLISVGERVEILVNFTNQVGQTLNLVAYNSTLAQGIPGFEPVNDPGNAANALGHRDFNLLHLTIASPTAGMISTIPNALKSNTFIPENTADLTRTLLISDTVVAGRILHLFNHQLFDHMRNDFTLLKDATEIWEIINTSPISHPFHIHDIEFNVLTRNGQPAPNYEQGWKDVLLVKPNESVRFIGKFDDYADPETPFMFHCHILKHEDDGLMGQFIVIDSLPPVIPMYRTFSVSTLMSAKPNSLKQKKKETAKLPNIANWRDTTVARSGGKDGVTIGIKQTDKTLAKSLGWIRYKKGMNLGKMYGSLQTDSTYNAPFDTVRKLGSNKKKIFVKELAPSSDNYYNPLLQAFGVFKLNLLSSQEEITPVGFDSLIFMGEGSPFSEYSLLAMMNVIDTVLTLYKTKTLPGGISASVGTTQLEQMRKMLNQINEAFDTTIALANGDSVVTGKGLKFTGLIPLSDVLFLQKEMHGKNQSVVNFSSDVKGKYISLLHNFPNPFNPTTVIGFSLLAVGNVTLKVYDVLGREVQTLLNNESMQAGVHEIQFDGSAMTSGVYFYRLSVEGKFSATKKFVLMK